MGGKKYAKKQKWNNVDFVNNYNNYTGNTSRSGTKYIGWCKWNNK